jgi:hypothetical protein
MKTKKFDKKLALNKQTIANLGTKEMHAIAGGAETQTAACNTCIYTCMTVCENCTEECTEGCITDIACPSDVSCPPTDNC